MTSMRGRSSVWVLTGITLLAQGFFGKDYRNEREPDPLHDSPFGCQLYEPAEFLDFGLTVVADRHARQSHYLPGASGGDQRLR
jgi:hypothetical protein